MMEYNLTKKDLMIFLTDWEHEFLYGIETQRALGQEISRKQYEKFNEIENKFQEIENDIKNQMASHKGVNSAIKPRSINLSYFISLKHDDLRFTILTEEQKQAIKKIKKYWADRTKNYKNWKNQKHWSYEEENISSRIDIGLFEQLKRKKYNFNKGIQNFVRKFLRDQEFRETFLEKIEEQYQKDRHIPGLEFHDPTDQYKILINSFPEVVTGKVHTIEKELFTLYFTFLSRYSVSYATRVALIHYPDLPKQSFIEKEDVIPILSDIINPKEKVEV